MSNIRTTRNQFNPRLLNRMMSFKIDLHKNADGTIEAKTAQPVQGKVYTATAGSEQSAINQLKQSVQKDIFNRQIQTISTKIDH